MPSDDDAEDYQGDTLGEEAEEEKSNVSEEIDGQDMYDESQCFPDSQVVPGDSQDVPDDILIKVPPGLDDALRLNAILLDVHNEATEKTKAKVRDTDEVSLASTIPLGPSWEDGVPLPAEHPSPERSKPKPSKEAEHIAKAKKELQIPAPWLGNQGKIMGL